MSVLFSADLTLFQSEIHGKKKMFSSTKMQFRGVSDTYLVTKKPLFPSYNKFQVGGISDTYLVKNFCFCRKKEVI